MLLRKQESYLESFHVKLQFMPKKAGYEAGIAVWWNMYSYASIGIAAVCQPNGEVVRTIVCRQPTGKAGEFNVRALLSTPIYLF